MTSIACSANSGQKISFSLRFNLSLVGWRVCFVFAAGFLRYRLAGCLAARGAFGPAGAGSAGFSDMCRGAQAGPDAGKPAADPPGRQGPGGPVPDLWHFFSRRLHC